MTDIDKQQEDILWTREDIEQALDGEWVSGLSTDWNAQGVNYIPGTIKKGQLAITRRDWGVHYKDTIDKLPLMIKKGAVAAIVDEDLPDNIPGAFPVYRVKGGYAALTRLGEVSRNRFAGKVIAITGSVGKTTTKEMLRHLLEKQAPTYVSIKNFNTFSMQAVSLAQIPPHYSFAVLETAISALSKGIQYISRPDVAIITDIQFAHADRYKTLDKILLGKARIFDGLEGDGTAILNRDIEQYQQLYDIAKAKGVINLLSFGENSAADIQLLNYTLHSDYSDVTIRVIDKVINFTLGQSGFHMIKNALAALTAIHALGSYEIEEIAADLAYLPAIKNHLFRKEIQFSAGSFTLIEDCFNASPASVKASIDTISLLNPRGRRIGVFGDMGALGKMSEAMHLSIAEKLSTSTLDKVFSIGKLMKVMNQALPKTIDSFHAETEEELKQLVSKEIRDGDVILLKGGHASDLVKSKLANYLTNFDKFP